MLIRDLAPTDLDRVFEINDANVPNVGAADRDHLARLAELCSIALVVDTDDDAGDRSDVGEGVTGFCMVFGPGTDYESENYRWFMERYDDAMYLDRVAFDASVQGRGLGQALYATVDERMRTDHPTMGQLTLEVNVDPPNDQSLRFHARQGFTEVGRRTSHGIVVSLMSRPV